MVKTRIDTGAAVILKAMFQATGKQETSARQHYSGAQLTSLTPKGLT